MGCPECDRLWKHYGELIRDQMIVLAEYARTLREGDKDRVRALNGAMECTHTFCQEAWAGLREHDATHEGKKPPTPISTQTPVSGCT
jgi:hypothetical protein